MFRIELLPAYYGDCIVISYGDPEAPSRILIDAGTTPTWENSLRGHLAPKTKLELFVLTHIDADHIAGAIPFLEEGTDIEIGEVWFNAWKHLPKNLLSASQGEVFSALIEARKIPWNCRFDEKAVMITDDELPEVELPGGMKLTVLSPNGKALGKLAKKWKKEITRRGLTPGDLSQKEFRPRRSFLARSPTSTTDVDKLTAMKFKGDRSAPNGSSIALLAEYDGKAVLLTGDAYASILTKSIGRLLESRGVEGGRLEIDACKISHHGSRGNTNDRLLQLLDCPRYLISCNGDVHKLPDNETIGRIIRFGGSRPEIVFNYDCERTEAWKDPGINPGYDYTTVYGEDGYYSLEL